ncbi:uncharacterized protein LOC111316745 isoform X2 [Durio zibethinus]|uniref:Reticulon-like protein n=1 Tax=Durio zibethinus TaxID=66656 RepID=A0A6P6BBX3_DURZI|nr:uncharacterized protein LOC111316745 isoform X2 [Durio zibethinus]
MAEHEEKHEESLMEKTAEKIRVHDSSSSSLDSDGHQPSTSLIKAKFFRLFGRERPVHLVFDGGKGALGVATVIWVLFELLEYHLLALVYLLLIIALSLLFLWSNATTFIKRSPPRIPEVQIPKDAFVEFAQALRFEINWDFAVVRDITSGRDLKKFLSLILPIVEVGVKCFDLGLPYRLLLMTKLQLKVQKLPLNEAGVKEFNLKQMWKSPNGTIWNIWIGSVFREAIICKNAPQLVPGWTKPICIGRQAFGDQYQVIDIVIKEAGKLKLVFEGQYVKTEFKVLNFTGDGGVSLAMYDTDEITNRMTNSKTFLSCEIEMFEKDMSTLSLPLMKGVEETSKVLVKVPKVVPWLCRVIQEGRVVSIGRKIKESVSSLILCSYKSMTHEFAKEAEVFNAKPIIKFNFKVCLMLLLVLTTGTRGVGSEDIGSTLIPRNTAMNSLLVNKNLRGHKLSERREMVGTEAAAMNDSINYKPFQGNSPPNNPVGKQANPYKRPCNPGEYCRQGKTGKKKG